MTTARCPIVRSPLLYPYPSVISVPDMGIQGWREQPTPLPQRANA